MNTRKYAKKTWKHIKAIRDASNMMEVSQYLNDAIIDYFGCRHFGLLKIRLEQEGHVADFPIIKMRNLNRMQEGQPALRSYLMTFIPDRMHNSIMYKNLSI